jgi:imidazolonepropionase-like amidohydrolase
MSVSDSPKSVSFSPEEFQAAIDEANRQGVPVAAHAHATAGIKQAVRTGVRSLEHGTYLDDEAIDLMVEHGTYLIPTTFWPEYYADGGLRVDGTVDYHQQKQRTKQFEWPKKAYRKGVKIGVGVDLGGHGYRYKEFAGEFAMLLRIGMTNIQAIQAGTRVNAELLMWDDRLGTIEPGKLADIIAVPGNPLDNMAALESVNFVMLGGKIINHSTNNVSQDMLINSEQAAH